MGMYYKGNMQIVAEVFDPTQMPWPKDVEEFEADGEDQGVYYTIPTTEGDFAVVEPGDYIVTEGLDDLPLVIEAEEFMQDWLPVPDDVEPKEGIAYPDGVSLSGALHE